MSKTPAARAAEEIIEKLEGRGGFDHWWGGVARTDQREIVDTLTGIIDAASTARPRPKLEIVHPGVNDVEANHVEIYIDGKFIAGGSRAHHTVASLAAIEAVARHVARALGADVDVTDDPAPQPYRYYVTFTIAVKRDGGFDYMPAVRWLDLPGPIEGPEDTDRLCAEFAKGNPVYPAENVRITNFIYVDGPS